MSVASLQFLVADYRATLTTIFATRAARYRGVMLDATKGDQATETPLTGRALDRAVVFCTLEDLTTLQFREYVELIAPRFRADRAGPDCRLTIEVIV